MLKRIMSLIVILSSALMAMDEDNLFIDNAIKDFEEQLAEQLQCMYCKMMHADPQLKLLTLQKEKGVSDEEVIAIDSLQERPSYKWVVFTTKLHRSTITIDALRSIAQQTIRENHAFIENMKEISGVHKAVHCHTNWTPVLLNAQPGDTPAVVPQRSQDITHGPTSSTTNVTSAVAQPASIIRHNNLASCKCIIL